MSRQLSGSPDPAVEGRGLAGEHEGEKVAVVLSGAVARGAFQAGALGQVMTTLFVNGIRPSIFVGTSAGAINAALWVRQAAGRDVRTVDDIMSIATDVNDVWRGMSANRTFKPLWSIATATRLGWPVVRGLRRDGDGVASLLDTAPLQQMAHSMLDEPRDLPEGVDALGVVGTWSPGSTRTVAGGAGRSVLFLQERQPQGWAGRPERALDVARGPIRAEHVLASSAVPAAFPAQPVTEPAARAGYYVDGGVRLNTPLEAAFALGATRVVLISAMSLAYPRYLPPDPRARPGTVDALSQVLHAVVADRAVEDLLNVRRINRMVTQARQAGVEEALTGSGGRPYRRAEVIAVSPPAGQLGALAEQVWQRRYADRWAVRRSNAILGRLLRVLGDGPGRGEMLSYLLFDEDYFADSIRYGRKAAVHALARGWQTDQIVDEWKPSSAVPAMVLSAR